MTLRAIILGCGSSGGVPRVGPQGWGACDPSNPRNRRRRCSIIVQRLGGGGATTLLIDTSPDLREQLLSAQIHDIDAIFYTHAHADHLHGIDDVRPLTLAHKRKIPAFMDEATSHGISRKFSYIFSTPPGSFYPPLLVERRINPGEAVIVDGPGGPIAVASTSLPHGDIRALSFRFSRPEQPSGGLAYAPDFNQIPPESRAHFENLDCWILDALRYRPHPSHASIPEALEWIEEMRPRRAFLTNLHTDVDYAALADQIPPNVAPAHDGLVVEFV